MNHIKLVLKRLLPLVYGSHKRGHVTEDETSDDGTKDDDNGGEESLAETDRAAVITLDEEHLIVEYRVVLVPNCEVEEICVEEVNILSWNPILLFVPD